MLKSQYFDWLCSYIRMDEHTLLFQKLFNTGFWWTIPFDANRADDGISLRYRFGRELGIPDPVICAEIDNCPCSILEVIVALALRCEESIMGDERIGNRTYIWIQDMLLSLGLAGYTDRVYDEREVDYILERFLSRQYSRTGDGGLFCIPNLPYDRDMRNAELWMQLNWYINKI